MVVENAQSSAGFGLYIEQKVESWLKVFEHKARSKMVIEENH